MITDQSLRQRRVRNENFPEPCWTSCWLARVFDSLEMKTCVYIQLEFNMKLDHKNPNVQTRRLSKESFMVLFSLRAHCSFSCCCRLQSEEICWFVSPTASNQSWSALLLCCAVLCILFSHFSSLSRLTIYFPNTEAPHRTNSEHFEFTSHSRIYFFRLLLSRAGRALERSSKFPSSHFPSDF